LNRTQQLAENYRFTSYIEPLGNRLIVALRTLCVRG